ncbi:Holliday junction branch migration protein RuvA [Sulfuriroseicoccus oceanibius]|uniref:Holliday junction branch migration complex subunit RuvA n=1 Tax=Sulfuriroseicoccus oceanibius TaxID=2707525 RepID=A0A6B3L8N7_9BACT|nr:Holliday junction branch migration protein RuvA [Sulfuriroseicoccus oceanibius]QQL46282.1 Holliday junction branch migration protein RuvA [Sulfuriroseicoccus oceanibius]
MIAFIKGRLEYNMPQQLVVDVHGVGYQVEVPIGTFDAVRVGDEVKVLTYFHVRESAQVLYGFANADQRDLFCLLIDRVSGVGPKLAMAVLGGMTVADFRACVVAGDAAALSKVKGVGKKTAERVMLELKDKVGVADAWQAVAEAGAAGGAHKASSETVLALISLGYKQADANKAVAKVVKSLGDAAAEATSDELLRGALRSMN